ncbi:protein of unknown function [Rhodovastum atsumiense]|nr:protein of unknown function [Rhodovastum atsumiense]
MARAQGLRNVCWSSAVISVARAEANSSQSRSHWRKLGDVSTWRVTPAASHKWLTIVIYRKTADVLLVFYC